MQPHRIVILFLLVLGGTAGLVYFMQIPGGRDDSPEPPSRSFAGHLSPAPWRQPRTVSGPWGTIDIEPFSLRINRERIQRRFNLSDGVPVQEVPMRWTFPGMSREEVADWLTRHRLPRSITEVLLTQGRPDEKRGAFCLTLDGAAYDSIPKALRLDLIQALSLVPENEAESHIRLYHPDFFEQWIQRRYLSATSRKRLMEYVFPIGDRILIYAPLNIATRFSDPQEATHVLQLLYRDVALRVYLQTPEPEKAGQVIEYWSQGGRVHYVEPLLNTLIENESRERLDILHLMPFFVRNRLNLYVRTTPRPGEVAPSEDCVWTSFNFFNAVPDFRYGDVPGRDDVINENYSMVDRAERFGDVIVLLNPRGGIVHACVYVAGPVVFTRDGAGKFVPFRLAYLDDVERLYANHNATRKIILRRDTP